MLFSLCFVFSSPPPFLAPSGALHTSLLQHHDSCSKSQQHDRHNSEQLSHGVLVVTQTIIKVQSYREELVAWLDLCGAEINVSKITGSFILLHQQILDSVKYQAHAYIWDIVT